MDVIVLAVNPVIATIGQIAAIIICLFIFIFILLAVAFNVAMAFGMAWVREKVIAIKLLRPAVESVNKASEAAAHGVSPADNESDVVWAIATVPAQTHMIDKKVDQVTDRVANYAIEFRARAEQGKAIVTTFFRPRPRARREGLAVADGHVSSSGTGYPAVSQERVTTAPVKGERDGHRRDVPVDQLHDVSSR